MKLIQKIFGSENDRTLKRYRRLVVRINELEPQMEQLQDADFPNKTEEYQKRYKDGEALDDLLSTTCSPKPLPWSVKQLGESSENDTTMFS